MAFNSKSAGIAVLVLRIFTLLILAASIAVMATNNFTLANGSKTKFTDLITYRYVFATACVGFVYTLIQIPFAVYYVCTEKRMIRNRCLPEFDFYGDKVISFLLATGVGAGFAVTYEFKKFFHDFFNALEQLGAVGLDEGIKFLNKGYISTGLLAAGFVCMAMTSVLSSISRTTTRGFFG